MNTATPTAPRVPFARLRDVITFKRILSACESPRVAEGTRQHELAQLLADTGRADIYRVTTRRAGGPRKFTVHLKTKGGRS